MTHLDIFIRTVRIKPKRNIGYNNYLIIASRLSEILSALFKNNNKNRSRPLSNSDILIFFGVGHY